MLYLPCRHHIHELILKSVFEVYWKKQTGPNVPLLNAFQKKWKEINQAQYESGIKDKVVNRAFGDDRSEILKFIESQLEVKIIES